MKNANVAPEELLGDTLIQDLPKQNVKRPWTSFKRHCQQNYREEIHTKPMSNTLWSSRDEIIKAHMLVLKIM